MSRQQSFSSTAVGDTHFFQRRQLFMSSSFNFRWIHRELIGSSQTEDSFSASRAFTSRVHARLVGACSSFPPDPHSRSTQVHRICMSFFLFCRRFYRLFFSRGWLRVLRALLPRFLTFWWARRTVLVSGVTLASLGLRHQLVQLRCPLSRFFLGALDSVGGTAGGVRYRRRVHASPASASVMSRRLLGGSLPTSVVR